MLYREPRVSPGVTAPILRSPPSLLPPSGHGHCLVTSSMSRAASRNGFFRWHAGLCAGGAVRDSSNRMRRRKSGTNRLPLRRGQVPGLAVLPRARASGYTTCRDAPEGGCMMLWKHSACAAGATIFPCRRQHTQPQVAHSLPPCLAGFLSNPRPFPGPRETGDVRGRAGQRANAWQGPNKSNAAHCW